MVGKRKVLTISTGAVLLAGFLFAAVSFLESMNPTTVATEAATLRVDLSKIPERGALEVDWSGYKIFLVKAPSPKAYLMPHSDGTYWLPDPTWQRAFIPCKDFNVEAEGFSCVDTNLHESWRENARWDLAGNTRSGWMPALQEAPYKLRGDALFLSPEYR